MQLLEGKYSLAACPPLPDWQRTCNLLPAGQQEAHHICYSRPGVLAKAALYRCTLMHKGYVVATSHLAS